MPIWDYLCKECKKTFETLQLSSADTDNTPTTCPYCSCVDTEKQITGSMSFSIKGPGVYAGGFSSSKSNKRRRK